MPKTPVVPMMSSDLSATAPASATLPVAAAQPDATVAADAPLWAVVFAGGIGSRFWPLSTPEQPKQLLALVGERPLIAETLARLAPLVPPERVLVLTSSDIADAIHAAIPDLPAENMLVEPRPLGTAAALAWGAAEVAKRAGPESVLCAVHADLAVAFPDEFRFVLRRAASLSAAEHAIVALGVVPTRPETGFGYVVPGPRLQPDQPLAAGGACHVRRFVEKPGPLLAEELLGDDALWHAGVFTAPAGVVLAELAVHARELAPGLPALAAHAYARFAGMIQSVSIERGLLERSKAILVVLVDCGWDDVGTWASLRRARELDDRGNGVRGRAFCVDAWSNVVHAEAGTVVLYGASQMLVVSLPGLTLVTPLERATDLKPLLDALPGSMRLQPLGPKRAAD